MLLPTLLSLASLTYSFLVLAPSARASWIPNEQTVLGATADEPAEHVGNSQRTSFPTFQTDPYSSRVFNSMWGLLRNHHQAYHPQGRSVVPGIVPRGTLLYHGRSAAGPDRRPEGTDWFAFDAELSYGFARMGRDVDGGAGAMWTYRVTEDLKIVYWDGWSALKWREGVLELQDRFLGINDSERPWPRPPNWPGGGGGPKPGPPSLLGRRKVTGTPGGPPSDVLRAVKLCEWGAEFGIDGYVREEEIFELIMCDMNRKTEVVSAVNITAPVSQPPVAVSQMSYAFTLAESWHITVADTRIRLAPAHAVSTYDPKYTSLARDVRDQSVFKQRIVGIMSEPDVEELRSELRDAVERWNEGTASGVDWSSLHDAATDRFASRFLQLRTALERREPGNDAAIRNFVAATTYGVLMTFTDARLLAAPVDEASKQLHRRLLADTNGLCSKAFTGGLDGLVLSEQEQRIKSAFETVMSHACQLSVDLFAGAVDGSGSLADWEERITGLMEWMAWPVWHRWERQCAWDEVRKMHDLQDDGPPRLECIGTDGKVRDYFVS
ncbi:hypothetical protein HKX48_003900 [Thoreauomyces humboldtii]|nr:hypothetical protein HKX48_003900 [Thoreauomyces humboldtii]